MKTLWRSARVALWALAATASSCDRQAPAPVASAPAPEARPAGLHFVDRAEAAGLRFQHTDGSSGKYYIVETLASGVGLFDYDEDGDLDIYFPNGRPLPPSPEGDRSASNALYRNNGDGTFTDVTAIAGVPGAGFSVGCAAGDYDGDGDLDLYVTGFLRSVLYQNQGKAGGYVFKDVTAAAGVDPGRFSAGASFLDIDNDGDLDLYVANYCEVDFAKSEPCPHNGIPNYCAPGKYAPEHDTLYLNNGDGAFKDISRESGIAADRPAGPGPRWGMGVLALDYNVDGLVDIYVANDVSDNFLWQNLGGGRFKNVAFELGVAFDANGDEQGSMGVDAGDYDRDGQLDIIVTNFQKQLNALYHHEGPLGYVDRVMAHGLGSTSLPMVGWGTGFFDFDHDGWLDLFVANGHLEDRIHEYDQSSTYLQPNQLFRNLGGRFEEASDRAGPAFQERHSARGAAFGDIDNDGDVDIVVSNSRQRPSLLVNESVKRGNWIRIELRGKKNRFAIGARVRVNAGGAVHAAELRSGHSYVSQNDLRLHFGLGEASIADKVEVRWPGGGATVRERREAGKTHRIDEE
jgi:hypothetical protein